MTAEQLNKIFETLQDWFFVLFYSIIGISAKIAHMSSKGQLTKKQGVISFGFGIFAGFLAHSIMENDFKYKWAVITISALAGENIVSWILGNSKEIMTRILNILLKNKEDNN